MSKESGKWTGSCLSDIQVGRGITWIQRGHFRWMLDETHQKSERDKGEKGRNKHLNGTEGDLVNQLRAHKCPYEWAHARRTKAWTMKRSEDGTPCTENLRRLQGYVLRLTFASTFTRCPKLKGIVSTTCWLRNYSPGITALRPGSATARRAVTEMNSFLRS
jgi:hypothetical protein